MFISSASSGPMYSYLTNYLLLDNTRTLLMHIRVHIIRSSLLVFITYDLQCASLFASCHPRLQVLRLYIGSHIHYSSTFIWYLSQPSSSQRYFDVLFFRYKQNCQSVPDSICTTEPTLHPAVVVKEALFKKLFSLANINDAKGASTTNPIRVVILKRRRPTGLVSPVKLSSLTQGFRLNRYIQGNTLNR